MNKFEFIGRLTRDPEVRYGGQDNSIAIARFSLAVARRIKKEGEPEADFFNCIAFGKLGETFERYVHKGNMVGVVGRAANNNYTNKDGHKVYGIDFIIEELTFCDSKNSNDNENNAPVMQDGFTEPVAAVPDNVDDDDLPFN